MSLSLDRTRGAAERTVRIAPDTDTVRLQVEIDEAADAGPYTLLLRADSAHEPYRAEGLVPRSAGPYRFVEAAIPRAAWAAGLVTVNVSAGHGQDGQGARAWTLRVVVDSGS